MSAEIEVVPDTSTLLAPLKVMLVTNTGAAVVVST
jgi:hypothetical protein